MLIESFETWQAHEDVAVGCGGHLASDMYDEDAPNPIVTWNKNPHFIHSRYVGLFNNGMSRPGRNCYEPFASSSCWEWTDGGGVMGSRFAWYPGYPQNVCGSAPGPGPPAKRCGWHVVIMGPGHQWLDAYGDVPMKAIYMFQEGVPSYNCDLCPANTVFVNGRCS